MAGNGDRIDTFSVSVRQSFLLAIGHTLHNTQQPHTHTQTTADTLILTGSFILSTFRFHVLLCTAFLFSYSIADQMEERLNKERKEGSRFAFFVVFLSVWKMRQCLRKIGDRAEWHYTSHSRRRQRQRRWKTIYLPDIFYCLAVCRFVRLSLIHLHALSSLSLPLSHLNLMSIKQINKRREKAQGRGSNRGLVIIVAKVIRMGIIIDCLCSGHF